MEPACSLLIDSCRLIDILPDHDPNLTSTSGCVERGRMATPCDCDGHSQNVRPPIHGRCSTAAWTPVMPEAERAVGAVPRSTDGCGGMAGAAHVAARVQPAASSCRHL
eukprot:365519-Chlamydomonas_euryale.AAC.4